MTLWTRLIPDICCSQTITVISVRQRQVVKVPVVQVAARRQGLHGPKVADLDRGPNAAVPVLDEGPHRDPRGFGDVVVHGDQGRGCERG